MLDPAKTSLPPSWSIPFTMTLRSRNVTGDAIGAALREAESHCLESGESPEVAFGDPVAYAATLATGLPSTGDGRLASVMAPTALGLAGLTLTSPTVEAWRRGTPVSVTAGLALGFAATLLVVIALVNPELHRRRTVIGALAIIGVVVVVGAPLVWTTPLVTAPVPLCLAIAALAVLGSALWHRGSVDPDVITDPLEGAQQPGASGSRGLARLLPFVTAWLFPIFAVGLGLFTWLLPGRAG